MKSLVDLIEVEYEFRVCEIKEMQIFVEELAENNLEKQDSACENNLEMQNLDNNNLEKQINELKMRPEKLEARKKSLG